MYRLTKIFELPEELTAGPSQYLPIDIPDGGSPTGWTTKRILTSEIAGSINQDLETTLGVGSVTGTNRLQISDPVNPLTFLDLVNATKLDLVQPSMVSDLVINLPITSGTLALEGAGGSLATADQAINTTGTRLITLGGSLGTDKVTIENLIGNDVIDFRGDNKVHIPTGRLAINTGFAAQGQQLAVAGANNVEAVTVYHAGYNTEVLTVTLAPVGGSHMEAFTAVSSNIHPSTKVGFVADITNGAANIAIDIKAGNIRTPSGGVGKSETVSFGGGASGDVQTMTFEEGIYISKTLVP